MAGLRCDQLMFEVTRRCNMKCEHCLRGAAQRIDMSDEIIEKTLSGVNSLRSVTFTGGEPFLNPHAIKHIFKTLDKSGIQHSDFWLATNGKIWDIDLINLFIIKSAEIKYVFGDEMPLHLAVSQDIYHTQYLSKEDEIKINMFKELAMYDDSKNRGSDDYVLINEGNAKKNHMGRRELTISGMATLESYDDDIYEYMDIIYINALGDVILDCDTSYATQRKIKIGNVLEDTLLNILLREEKKKEEKKCA